MAPMLKLLLGDPNFRKQKRYQPVVSDINLLEEIAPLSDEDLRRRTAEFHQRLENSGKYLLGMRHVDVQLSGRGV